MQALNITIFGIIALALDVGIVNVFGFHAICVRLHPDFNSHAFGHCVTLSGKKVTSTLPPSPLPSPPKSEGSRTHILLDH